MKTEVRGQRIEVRGQKTEDGRQRAAGCRLHATGCRFAWVLACSLWLVAWGPHTAFAGNIDSTAAPSSDTTRMYTLEQIYQKVLSGTTPTKQSGGFNEPSAGPGSTMYTLDNIEAKIAAGTTTAAVGDVLDSKTFITRTTGNGETAATGTMPDNEGDNVSTAQVAAGGVNYFTAPAGYYDGDDRVSATDAQVAALDSDITAGNIKDAITIFGVLGTYTGSGGGSAGLPKTGQTTNYHVGDDEDYADPAEEDIGLPQGQGTWASYWSARFTDNGDGTVTDNATGLMWAQDGSAAGCNNGGTLSWTAAIDWAEALSFAGYADWRLPNAYELFSICLLEAGAITSVKAAGAPYINQVVFPNTVSGGCWSSTTYPINTGYALYVYFAYGGVNGTTKGSGCYVRAVRGPD